MFSQLNILRPTIKQKTKKITKDSQPTKEDEMYHVKMKQMKNDMNNLDNCMHEDIELRERLKNSKLLYCN
jgi:hypothetical protein